VTSGETALLRDLGALGGAGALVVEFARGEVPQAFAAGSGMVRIGVSRAGSPPTARLDAFDILLNDDPAAARPWVGLCGARLNETIDMLQVRIGQQPVAAAICAQILRLSDRFSFEEALVVESIAYSALLASEGFKAWREATPVRRRKPSPAPRVLVDQTDAEILIKLNRPEARNAFDARMRDELAEALDFALIHPDAPRVVLTGVGPAFSAGGDLDEFGEAKDVGAAHLVRTLVSSAKLVHRLGERIEARVHGACVGAGIEVPAAAAHVVARADAFFRLPEVSMGLIPGAGGTASIPRRIGRQRACFMAISGADIDLETAMAWGLVDVVESAK
jgi:hypothetical protein